MSVQSIRDGITERFENAGLAKNSFYYDGNVNIGYGYNITGNTSSAFAALTATGVGLSITTTQYDDTIEPDALAPSQANANAINNALGITITQAEAQQLMDNYYTDVVIPGLTADITNLGSLPDSTQAALEDMYYHNSTLLGPLTWGYAEADDLPGVAEQLAFNAVNATNVDPTQPGIEYRSLADAMLALGAIPSFSSSSNLIGRLDTSSAKVDDVIGFLSDTLQPTNTLGSGGETAQAYIASWGSGATSDYNTIVSGLEADAISHGYYVPQPSDGNTESAIADSIAGMSMNGVSISSSAVENINAPFVDSSLTTGGLVRIPLSKIAIDSFPTTLTPLLVAKETYVLDPGSSAAYVVGGAFDGSTDGALIVDDSVNSAGNYTIFDIGTYQSASIVSGEGVVTLSDPAGVVLGAYNTDPSLTLPDGLTISLPDSIGVTLTDPLSSSATPEEVLLSYLSQLGDSVASTTLNTDNFDYLNPTGSGSYSVTGTPDDDGNVNFTSSDAAPGATITGLATTTKIVGGTPTTVTANNILHASGDLSQDDITGIQVLDVEGSVTLLGDQFKGFTTIEGGGTIPKPQRPPWKSSSSS